MAQARGNKDYLNLLKGLNTEANPLAFPEGYTADESNFVLALEGNVRARRKGLSKYLANDLTYTSLTGENNVQQPYTYYWEEADLILVVVRDDAKSILVILENDENYTEVDTYEIYEFDASVVFKPSFSTILDGVVITIGSNKDNTAKPIFVSLGDDGSSVQIREIDIYFRDFELLDDGTSISFRPNSLTQSHTYNLLNAGWYAQRKNEAQQLVDPLSLFTSSSITDYPEEHEFDATNNKIILTFGSPNALSGLGTGDTLTIDGATEPTLNITYTVDDVVSTFIEDPDSEFGDEFLYVYTVTVVEDILTDESGYRAITTKFNSGSYPSNADIPILGLKTDTDTGYQYFDPDTLDEVVLGNTEAPRGHYIYDIQGDKTRDSVLLNKNDDGSPSTTVSLKATITR